VYDHKAYTEKSLGRIIKAKAKADRAAARHAQQQTQMFVLGSASTPSSSTTATPAPASENATPTPADSPHEADEPTPASKESPPPDRTEMLRAKPDVVGRFMRLTVPILVDVYAASVITTVRIKTLTGLLKAISYLEADGIKQVLMVSRRCYKVPNSGLMSFLVRTHRKLRIVYSFIKGPSDPRYWRVTAC
jgi:E3 ubiquitin-protein ligase TRIP12